MDEPNDVAKRPLTALVRFVSDGRILKYIFLAMLAMTVATVGIDLREMVAAAPDGIPGSQRVEPAPMDLPRFGDQTRTYLPKTMPVGPSRRAPRLPGINGPVDTMVMGDPMQFYKGTDGDYSAVGTITNGTAERLQDFVDENEKQIGRLFLHSPGGSVADALAMSRIIREAGISTVVPANAYCASSCPLVLAGGLYRNSGADAWVGVHQVYSTGDAIGTLQRGMAEAQTISAVCQNHLEDMGVDPKLWVYAMQTPPANLFILTEKQILDLRLANGPRPTTLPIWRPASSG